MTLRHLLDQYLLAHSCSPRYVESLRRTVRKAEGSGLMDIRQLSANEVNSFLAGLPKLSNTTRSNIRRELCSLWRFAHEIGLTDTYPTRVLRVKPDRRPVQAWTRQQLGRMLALAESDATPISGRWADVSRSDVMPPWICLGFDTALRFADIHGLRIEDFRDDVVAISAAKTGKPLFRRISEDTQVRVARLFAMSPDGTLFLWCLPRRRALLMWRDFLREHNLPGSSKWLRRSCATELEMAAPGSATHYLQHSSPTLVHHHYLDKSQFAVPRGPAPIITCAKSAGTHHQLWRHDQ
jgi:integrase